MFTGIIEEIGTITRITRGRVHRITIESDLVNRIGDSIAIQGVCLTVTDVTKHGFTVDAMRQTQRITTIDDWHRGSRVNLERAMKIGDRLGGHIMLGHVDDLAKCIRRRANTLRFQVQSKGARYLIPKGSIGIDGVSLTIGEASQNTFTVNLIPFTSKHTTLGTVRAASFVNIEYDYLVKFMQMR
jgi:riboflavin synthase